MHCTPYAYRMCHKVYILYLHLLNPRNAVPSSTKPIPKTAAKLKRVCGPEVGSLGSIIKGRQHGTHPHPPKPRSPGCPPHALSTAHLYSLPNMLSLSLQSSPISSFFLNLPMSDVFSGRSYLAGQASSPCHTESFNLLYCLLL